MLNWYAIQAAVNRERPTALALADSLDTDTYSPFFTSVHRQGEKFVERVQPLFPGYFFAHLSLEHHSLKVRRTKNVKRIVSVAIQPTVVDDWIIDEIRAREVNGLVVMEELRAQRRQFRPGDEVEATDGSWMGKRGIFRQDLKGMDRVIVLMAMLGAPREVEMSRLDLALVIA